MSKKVVLFSLQTFSTTGGIQKMTRTLAHSLHTLAEDNKWDFSLWSVYDSNKDLLARYLPPDKFVGFNLNRVHFIFKTIFQSKKPDIVILSHINLAMIGLVLKLINPECKVWLITHGIEVWRPLSFFKRSILKNCDKVICVSNFTRDQIIKRHGTKLESCTVLNNAVDPFMKLPESFTKPARLLKRYRITMVTPVLFTLTRLASTEQYKGHDQVIKALSRLKYRFPDIKYILSGKYDYKEEQRIMTLISDYRVEQHVILTGFIDEHELSDHFLLADIFVLPSKKEGFGIVFIEALVCGLRVICGNVDGSVDAIRNGELGKAINPDDIDELEEAITHYLKTKITKNTRKYLQRQCLIHFNEKHYMENLEKLINNA
jgi:glycosyltransferase involved in cell wall biosynthesis